MVLSASRGAWFFALLIAFFLCGMTTLVRADFFAVVDQPGTGGYISRSGAGWDSCRSRWGFLHYGHLGLIVGERRETVSFAPDGSRRWSHTFDSGKSGDQARGIARGPGNLLYVVGNTPGPNDFAQVLILIYDATNGTLLNTIKSSGGPNRSSLARELWGMRPGTSTCLAARPAMVRM